MQAFPETATYRGQRRVLPHEDGSVRMLEQDGVIDLDDYLWFGSAQATSGEKQRIRMPAACAGGRGNAFLRRSVGVSGKSEDIFCLLHIAFAIVVRNLYHLYTIAVECDSIIPYVWLTGALKDGGII